MAEYFAQFDGVVRDELQGGNDGIATELFNVAVGASAVIERGMLLCDNGDEFAIVSSANDSVKPLAVAAVDFTADAEHTVTQAYTAGKFNRERIKLGGDSSLTIDSFAEALRRDNIRLTSIKDKFKGR